MMTPSALNRPISFKIKIFIISFSILAINGCITSMSGRQAIEGETGIRYYLPAPHLIVTPKPDGTASFEIKYLPDPNNAYTLNLNSLFSSATFDVQLTDGMLTSITLDADAENILSEALKTAGALKVKQIEKDNAEEQKKKKTKDEKTQASEKEAEELRKKRDDLKIAEAKLDFYKSQSQGAISAGELQSAEWNVKELTLQVKFLEEKINQSNGDALNEPDAAYNPNLANAYGPVIFRILPADNGGVRLVSLNEQQKFITSVEPEKKPSVIEVSFVPSTVIKKKDDKDVEILLQSSHPIQSVDSARTKLVKPAEGASAPPVLSGDKLAVSITSADRKDIKIVMLRAIKSGNYRLDLTVIPVGSKDPQMVSVPITWMLP